MLKQELQQFIESIDRVALHSRLDPALDISLASLRRTIDIYANETFVGLDLIEHNLSKDQSVLEVGAGLCLLSLFLKSRGFDVTALEPSIGGFDYFNGVRRAILEKYNIHGLVVIEKSAQQLNKDDDGSFDLIYSSNVLEHIPDLKLAIEGMSSVLSPKGKMFHACPNYLVPYEPHLGIPVFGFWSTLSERLFRSQINANRELWESLNFIGYFQICRMAKRTGLDISFQKQVMYDAFERLDSDPEFAKRHQGLMVGKVFTILKQTRLLAATRYIPPALATPMKFTLKHNSD